MKQRIKQSIILLSIGVAVNVALAITKMYVGIRPDMWKAQCLIHAITSDIFLDQKTRNHLTDTVNMRMHPKTDVQVNSVKRLKLVCVT